MNGKPESEYDPNLRLTFASHNDLIEGQIPNLWAQFHALKSKPVLVFRGSSSDILTVETVDRMREIKPDLDFVSVPNRGHVPFLDEPEAAPAIADFLYRTDGEIEEEMA